MAKRKEAAIDLPPWVPVVEWEGWLEVRRAKRVPNTERALRLAVSQLEKIRDMGIDPKDALDEATMKGWQGIMARYFEGRAPVARNRSDQFLGVE